MQGCSSNTQAITPTIQTENINPEQQTHLEQTEDSFEDEYRNEDTEEKPDPLKNYNHIMTQINDTLFISLVNPISKGYAYITPKALQLGIMHFIYNIEFPIRFTNNLLQGKFQNSVDELERFLVNTTVGIGGLFDPASTYMNLPTHNEDFGQTLGYYGVGAGYHVVLPFLGPSNLRDIIGLLADGYTSPLIYQSNLKKYKLPQNYVQSMGIYSLKMINKNAQNLGAYESLKKDAIDLYPFLKEIYEQKRTADIAE